MLAPATKVREFNDSSTVWLRLPQSGPLWVRGGIAPIGSDGQAYEIRHRITLCRCGKSENKPFCNGARAADPKFRDGLGWTANLTCEGAGLIKQVQLVSGRFVCGSLRCGSHDRGTLPAAACLQPDGMRPGGIPSKNWPGSKTNRCCMLSAQLLRP
jgi:hypothetical protein